MAYATPDETARFAIDGHLHVYPGHDLDILADACLRSLGKLGAGAPTFQPAALLTESSGHDFFRRTRQSQPKGIRSRLEPGPDKDTLWLRHPDHNQPLLLFAGRQIATAERLEMLALTRDLDIPDGLPLPETVRRIRDGGAFPCLAWAPGKWWGLRGRMVRDLIDNPDVFMAVGDSALRPLGWGEPRIMRQSALRGLPLLAGSDPLPLAGEEHRAGQYGFSIDLDAYDPRQPAAALRAALARGNGIVQRIGKRCNPCVWLHGQIMYRKHKPHLKIAKQ